MLLMLGYAVSIGQPSYLPLCGRSPRTKEKLATTANSGRGADCNVQEGNSNPSGSLRIYDLVKTFY